MFGTCNQDGKVRSVLCLLVGKKKKKSWVLQTKHWFLGSLRSCVFGIFNNLENENLSNQHFTANTTCGTDIILILLFVVYQPTQVKPSTSGL